MENTVAKQTPEKQRPQPRSVVAKKVTPTPVENYTRSEIMNLGFHNVTLTQALDWLVSYLDAWRAGESPACTLFFINVHSFEIARRDADFRHCINKSDLVLPDGSGLNYAGRLYKMPEIQNLNGTDFIPELCRKLSEEGKSVYLLGANETIIDQAEEHVRSAYPGLQVAGSHSGYFYQDEHEKIIADINSARPDLLLVALGSPLQEKWVMRNASRLQVGICSAVGGLFDFWSGQHRRAPLWMRNMGIEWLHRFYQDPLGKWKRVFIEIPVFLTRALVGSLRSYRVPDKQEA